MKINTVFINSKSDHRKGIAKELQRVAMGFNPARKKVYLQTIKTVRQDEAILAKLRSVRDDLNIKVKNKFTEAADFRIERDNINTQVKTLKKERNELTAKSMNINSENDNQPKMIPNKAKKIHSNLKKLASQSQENHDQMLSSIREARKIRKEADDAHTKVIEQVRVVKICRSQIKLMLKEAQMEYADFLQIRRSTDRSEFVKMIQVMHFANTFG